MPRPPSQDRRQRTNAPKSRPWVQHATRGPQIADKRIIPFMVTASASSLIAWMALADPWYLLAGVIAVYALHATTWTPPTTKEP